MSNLFLHLNITTSSQWCCQIFQRQMNPYLTLQWLFLAAGQWIWYIHNCLSQAWSWCILPGSYPLKISTAKFYYWWAKALGAYHMSSRHTSWLWLPLEAREVNLHISGWMSVTEAAAASVIWLQMKTMLTMEERTPTFPSAESYPPRQLTKSSRTSGNPADLRSAGWSPDWGQGGK